MQGKSLYIIDGYGQIFRSYYGFIGNPLTDKDGNNVSAIFGFFNTLMMIVKDYKPDYLAVAMDSHGPTFRDQLFSEYKANRSAAPEDLISQIETIKKMLPQFGIQCFERRGLEADDMIASLCRIGKEQGAQSVLVTADKDLLQLVQDGVFALRPAGKGKEYRLFKDEEVKEAFGVLPNQIRDYLVILGDSSDNVPGIKGIGEKGAAKLLSEYGTIDNVYEHISEMSPSIQAKLEAARDHIELTKKLVSLKDDVLCAEDVPWDAMSVSSIKWDEASKSFAAIGSNMLSSTARRLSGSKPAEEPQPAKAKAVPSDGKYQAVTDADVLEGLLEKGSKAPLMAFDIETTDIDDMKAVPVGFSFSWEERVSYYVPLACPDARCMPLETALALLQRYLPVSRIVGQNIKYDIKVLRTAGVTGIHPVFDTMIAAWLLDSSSNRYSLDDLADKYLGIRTVHFDEVVKKDELFSSVALEDAVRYGAEDSDLTLRLCNLFVPMLKEKGLDRLMDEMEMPLLEVLADMEYKGIILDPARLEAFGKDLSVNVEDLQKDICTIAGHDFNINSPKQLSEVLFVERHLPSGSKTKSGYSTDAGVLDFLAETTDDPIVPLILRYRAMSKLLSTYVTALPTLVNARTGRIHTSFLQTGTATGRLSSKNPNLQNIPVRTDEGRRIREAFVPREGCILLSADYAQIELAVLAHFSGDASLRQAFIDREDVHRRTAAEIFGIFPEMVTPQQRRIAKTINFGVIYGMSAFRLANDLGIPRKEAQAFIDAYFTQYSGIRTFMDGIKDQARKDGFVRTMSGHVRYIPEMLSSNKTVLAAAERAAVNTVIQGTAAEIMKSAMTRLHEALAEKKLEAAILLQVHDELILEVPLAELDEVKSVVRECMEGAASLSIPLRVDMETGHTWGEMH